MSSASASAALSCSTSSWVMQNYLSIEVNEENIKITRKAKSFTCSLFIAAIKGRMTGFNLLGKPDIQTTAEATKEQTVTCKLFCIITSSNKAYVNITNVLGNYKYQAFFK
jgi:hypothetical protein